MTGGGDEGSRRRERVVIVEDHALLAQSLAFALEAQGLEVARCDDLRRDAVLGTIEAHDPSIVLLDLDLGPHGDSIPLIPDIVALGASVVMLTASRDPAQRAACIEAGAVGVMDKAAPFDQLLAGMGRVLREHSLLTPGERERVLAGLERHRAEEQERLERFVRLSDREAEVLQALIEGRSAERIAEANVVSLATVRTQIRSVLVKLGVNSQLAAVALARRSGWSLDQR